MTINSIDMTCPYKYVAAMRKDKRDKRISIRCTEKELNKIEHLAKQYATGNVSAWIIFNAINGERKFITGYDRKK